MSPQPRDQALYESVKRRVNQQYSKPSAYRSSAYVKEYKEAYKQKHGGGTPYIGKRGTGGLTRWHQEKWRNQRGEEGYKKKDDIYRPTTRVNEKTPTTMNELSSSRIKKAQEEKRRTGRVKRF